MEVKGVLTKALLVTLIFFPDNTGAQTHEKWADVVNWDGVTPWRNYLIYSPGYLGPNALPVPSMSNGTADSVNSIALYFAFHSGTGDKTKNLRITSNYCISRNKLSVEISWVPIESFTMSPEIKDKRHVYLTGYHDSKAKGDIYSNVALQILNRWRKHIHLAVRAGFRYPTSSSVDAARFTDAPGYHFDISAGKSFTGGRFKLNAMGGVYIWQLNTEGQNDAVLFGGGFEYSYKNCRMIATCRGYSGYRHNGDQPLMVAASFEKKFKAVSLLINLQHGLRDFDFSSVETGIKYIFN